MRDRPSLDTSPVSEDGLTAVDLVGPPDWGAAGFRLDGWAGRWRAWLNMFFVDHGFFRYVYLNFRRIDDDAYRAAQPGPSHFARIRERGVRTVVNLRGGRQFGSYPLEREACDRLGLAYEEITLRSREAPSLQTLQEAADLLDRVEYPVLFHCKSGADRSGLMAALYLILKAKRPASEAKRMLALRYGHVRQSKTGVLDAFLDAFDAAEQEAAATGRDLSLLEWARSEYDAKSMTANSRATSWASWLIDTVLNRE